MVVRCWKEKPEIFTFALLASDIFIEFFEQEGIIAVKWLKLGAKHILLVFRLYVAWVEVQSPNWYRNEKYSI